MSRGIARACMPRCTEISQQFPLTTFKIIALAPLRGAFTG
jgi:hypothetical protein